MPVAITTMAAAGKRVGGACIQCGLPVRSGGVGDSLFCCHACRLVARIVGRQERGDHAWNLLRLGIGALLAMNVMMISLLLYSGNLEQQTIPVFRNILLGLSAPAMAILLYPFFGGAALDLLIAGGALAAFTVSAVNTLRGTGPVYFDTATMLPVLVTFGKMIESAAKAGATDLLHSLEALLPATALRITAEGTAEVDIDLLRAGDLVRVRPGERIAVDGCIKTGSTTIAEAAFTGEFLPRLCGPGDGVLAGTINGTGSLIVEAERAGGDLLLNRVIALIHNAWQNPSETERIAERAATLFIPAVLLIATGAVLLWAMRGNAAQGWLSALSVLVVACPCTMGIATPLATSLAIARAAREGIVVRGGDIMERLGKTELVFFDKTGTITSSHPAVKDIVLFDPLVDENELLGRLAALESASEHALAGTIVAEAAVRGVAAGSVTEVNVSPGRGISGVVTWRGEVKKVSAGTAAYVSPALAPAEEGSTAIDVAWDGEVRGRVLIAETIREEAGRSVTALGELGISAALVSGDRFSAVAAIGRKIGVERVEAPRNPEEKLECLSTAIAAGRIVAMVGDGINDAPALAAAHIGIAFGCGIDLVRQAGNVVVLSDRLMQVPWLIKLSRETRRIIRQNFTWSFGYNSIALAAAAAGWLHPLLAATAMVVSSLTVLGNSLRIRNFPTEV